MFFQIISIFIWDYFLKSLVILNHYLDFFLNADSHSTWESYLARSAKSNNVGVSFCKTGLEIKQVLAAAIL